MIGVDGLSCFLGSSSCSATRWLGQKAASAMSWYSPTCLLLRLGTCTSFHRKLFRGLLLTLNLGQTGRLRGKS
jgi:hypothetical protein